MDKTEVYLTISQEDAGAISKNLLGGGGGGGGGFVRPDGAQNYRLLGAFTCCLQLEKKKKKKKKKKTKQE